MTESITKNRFYRFTLLRHTYQRSLSNQFGSYRRQKQLNTSEFQPSRNSKFLGKFVLCFLSRDCWFFCSDKMCHKYTSQLVLEWDTSKLPPHLIRYAWCGEKDSPKRLRVSSGFDLCVCVLRSWHVIPRKAKWKEARARTQQRIDENTQEGICEGY